MWWCKNVYYEEMKLIFDACKPMKCKYSQIIVSECIIGFKKVLWCLHRWQCHLCCGRSCFPMSVGGFTCSVWGLVRRWVSRDDPQISTSIPTSEYPASSIPIDAPDLKVSAPRNLREEKQTHKGLPEHTPTHSCCPSNAWGKCTHTHTKLWCLWSFLSFLQYDSPCSPFIAQIRATFC